MKKFLIIIFIVVGSIVILTYFGLTAVSYAMIYEIAAIKSKPQSNEKINSGIQVIEITKVTSATALVTSSSIVVHSQNGGMKDENISVEDPPSIDQFLSFNSFKEAIQSVEMPDLCKIICEPSRFEFAKGKKEPIYDVINQYNAEGVRAMSDPKFRLAYHRALIIGKV